MAGDAPKGPFTANTSQRRGRVDRAIGIEPQTHISRHVSGPSQIGGEDRIRTGAFVPTSSGSYSVERLDESGFGLTGDPRQGERTIAVAAQSADGGFSPLRLA
jgi:hypothetical protein